MARGRKLIKTIELEERTLKEASEEFYKYNMIKGLSIETQKGYKSYVDAFVFWCGGETILSDLTTNMLDEYVFKKTEQGIKTVSVATTMVHIRRFLNFCTSRGYMDKLDVVIPKYEKTLKDPYTDEEMKKLLEKPKSNNWVEYRNWVMVQYFFSTGQRLSTVLNIKVLHVDLLNQRVKLIWNKDKRQKYMPISSAMAKVIEEYIRRSGLVEQDYLFPEYEGKQLQKRSAEDAIADYNRSRNVEKTSIHLFRATFAKNYIVNGGNPAKLQKLMNHKTIEQTMKYVKLYSTDVSEDLDLFNPLDVFQRNHYVPKKRTMVNF